MKRIIVPFFAAALSGSIAVAQQVPKTVIAEHFTNTYCSVCASRNPSFYSNLWSYSGVLHIAYHPSSPYSSCPLSLHNVAENDARTRYYGIYGATPRLVVQGQVLPTSTSFSTPSIFTSQLGQYTSFAISSMLTWNASGDSLRVIASIKKVDTSSLTKLLVTGALTEDTLFFTASNGETRHYDVFRKMFWGTTPLSVTAPTTVGDSVTLQATVAFNSTWSRKRMSATLIAQDTLNRVVQAKKSNNLPATTGLTNTSTATSRLLYPNPVRERLYLTSPATDNTTLSVFTLDGRLVYSRVLNLGESFIDVSALLSGAYLVVVKDAYTSASHRIMKQ
jgi:hypothetical protein